MSEHEDRVVPPIVVRLSKPECDHIDRLRARSIELAVERGHLRRN